MENNNNNNKVRFGKGYFTFIGEGVLGRKEIYTKQNVNDLWDKKLMNFNVKCGLSSIRLKLEYFCEKDTNNVNLYDINSNMFKIDADLTDKDFIVERIPSYRRIIIDKETDFEKKEEYMKLVYKINTLERRKEKNNRDEVNLADYKRKLNSLADNRIEVASMGGAFKYIEEMANYAKQNDLLIKTTGYTKSNYYKGKTTTEYIPTSFEYVPKDSDKKSEQEQLTLKTQMYYAKDLITDNKEKKQLEILGYLGEKDKGDNKLYSNVLFTYTYNNEQEEKIKDILYKKLVTVKEENGDVKDIYDDMLYKVDLITKVIDGAEEKEINLEDYDEEIRLLVEQDMLDIRKLGGFSENKKEFRIVTFAPGNLQNGADLVMSLEDAMELIPRDDSDKKENEVKKDNTEENKNLTDEEIYMNKISNELFNNCY